MKALRVSAALAIIIITIIATTDSLAQDDAPTPPFWIAQPDSRQPNHQHNRTTAPSLGQPIAVVQAPQNLTLELLEAIAWQRNPTLVQARANIVAAEGRAIQARLYPNPKIGYQGEEMGVEGTAGQQGVFVEQKIVTGGKLRLSGAKFSHEANQARWMAEAQQYRVVNAVRINYYEVLALQRLIEIRRELLGVAQEALQTTEQMMNVGQANKADLLQARIEERQLDIALQKTRIHYQAAWRELAALIGDACLPPTPIAGDLEAGSDIPDLEQTYCALLESSPEIQAARSRISRNRFGLRRELVEPIPNVDLRAGTTYDFESEDQVANLEVGLALPVWDQNQGNIRVARGQLAKAQAELRRVELAIRQRLAKAYQRHGTARLTIENYRSDVLPASKEVYNLYLESFRNRRAAWPQVLVAQRNYFEISTEYLQALVDARRAEIAINGFLLVDGLDEPAGPESEGDARGGEQNRLRESLENPIMGAGRGVDDRAGGRH